MGYEKCFLFYEFIKIKTFLRIKNNFPKNEPSRGEDLQREKLRIYLLMILTFISLVIRYVIRFQKEKLRIRSTIDRTMYCGSVR